MDHLFFGFIQEVGQTEQFALFSLFVVALSALVYAIYLRRHVLGFHSGTAEMKQISAAIAEGAEAYLTKQGQTIWPSILVLSIIMFFSVYVVEPTKEAALRFHTLNMEELRLLIGLGRSLAFVMGAMMSILVGKYGMRMSVATSSRVAAAALDRNESNALKIAYRGATVTGMLTDGLGLFGGALIFAIFGTASPDVLLGFGFGGTLLALYMRVGGGIFTKAADVGADLVGKLEHGLPEDDPRNAAVIADNVGDNVGDCAGMAADIFESYEVTMVATMILGISLMVSQPGPIDYAWVFFPLLVRAIGVICSLIGTYYVRTKNGTSSTEPVGDALKPIFRGFIISGFISVVLFGVLSYLYLQDFPLGWWRPFVAVLIGILLVIAIHKATEYYTSPSGYPVREILRSLRSGSATGIITGAAIGMESAFMIALLIFMSIMGVYEMFSSIGLTFVEQFNNGLYGVSLMGIGALTLTGNNVAMDAFGPITDNAQGIGEMGWGNIPEEEKSFGRKLLNLYDATGNGTKATTKGVAISSAVIAAVTLFGSYMVDVSKAEELVGVGVADRILTTHIRMSIPNVFIGTGIGAALVFLFASGLCKSVSRAAMLIVVEVRDQIRRGVLENKIKPDYSKAVMIATKAAQHELTPLVVTAVVPVLLVGMFLGVEALGGFLGGAILSGLLMASFLNNSGGAWDNTKKVIEGETPDPEKGMGKGSPRHDAAITCDTVGDPWKDTAGPAINPLLKVLNITAVIVAPILVQHRNLNWQNWTLASVLIAAFVWAVLRTKRGVPHDDPSKRLPKDN